jgi:hypothetical protein
VSDNIQFSRNYGDLSTSKGFQFEFFCDRCGDAHRTKFQPSMTGTASTLLDAANSLFGGVLGRAADLSERANSATWEQAHDKAFAEAVEEIRPSFAQCPKCSAWVCRKSCWNGRRGLCKNCAPDLDVEMSAAQSSKAVEQAWTEAAAAQEDLKIIGKGYDETIQAVCPHCAAALHGRPKFCPECGGKLQQAAHCTECGSKLNPGAKFCGECGAKAQ